MLDLVHLLNPSLAKLIIVEGHPSDLTRIDLSLMRILKARRLTLKSTNLPIDFIREVAKVKTALLNALWFENIFDPHDTYTVRFSSTKMIALDSTHDLEGDFDSINELIAYLRDNLLL